MLTQRSKAKVPMQFLKLPHMPVMVFLPFTGPDFKGQNPHFMDLSFLHAEISFFPLYSPFHASG